MKNYLFLSILLFCFSCSSESKYSGIPEDALVFEESIEVEPPRTAEPPPSDLIAYNDQSTTQQSGGQPTVVQAPKKDNRKIIRNAQMTIEVSDYEAAIQKLRNVAKEYDAFIANESERNRNYRISNQIIFRLRPNNLDKFVASIEKIASNVEYKQVSANDVTKQYLDKEIRIKAKQDAINRYRELMQQAKNVTEVLSVERELRQAIELRDALQGELNYLRDQVNFSTLTVDMFQAIEVPHQGKGFFARIGNSFASGWHGFLDFIVSILALWPFLILGVGLLVLLVRVRRR